MPLEDFGAIDSSGNSIDTTTVSPTVATYSASALGVASALTATDVFTIFGSATKTVKISRIAVSATQGSILEVNILLIKRSAANTGGTSSSVTKVPLDSNFAAATATVLSYTANPTALGASVGTIRNDKCYVPATNTASASDKFVYTFGGSFQSPVVLRGTGEGLCFNLNSTTVSGSSFDFWVEWTEE